jgi:hypothetical protein
MLVGPILHGLPDLQAANTTISNIYIVLLLALTLAVTFLDLATFGDWMWCSLPAAAPQCLVLNSTNIFFCPHGVELELHQQTTQM